MVTTSLARAGDTAAEVRQWLDKMSHSSQKINFEGTFVYRRGDQVTAMKIVHVADENGEREKLSSLNGPVREIIRDKGVARITTDKKSVVIEKRGASRSLASKTPEQIDQIEKYYSFSSGGESRAASRPVRIVNIVPKDDYRYGYRVSLDQQTGTMLQSDLLNEEGAPIEQVMFITFDLLDKVPPAMREPAKHGEPAGIPSDGSQVSQPLTGGEGWRVGRMPGGFVLAEHYRHQVPHSQVFMNHMVLTDGLASVSIFIEKNNSHHASPFVGVSRMGVANAYGTRINDYQVTVVGEVPVATVEMIGKSIKYQSPGAAK
ncbi:MAG: MucB/RseB C-terminal domain-containing protein [Gammaproteobacteria bacterium]